MRTRAAVVNDRRQKDYRYEHTARPGRDFDPGFTPDLTPQEMLRLGVFCGKYMTDTRGEFAQSWFARAKLAKGKRDCKLNFFGVDARAAVAVEAQGLDPLGRPAQLVPVVLQV